MRRRNAATHALVGENKEYYILLVQEPWFDRIGVQRGDAERDGVVLEQQRASRDRVIA